MTWALAVISITATILTGRKIWWGWIVVGTSCAAWSIYGLFTKQFGFAALQAFYVLLTIYNAHRWFRERKQVQEVAKV